MYLAEHLAHKGCAVRLVEKESQFMTRASLNNQARVHNGYHYPRSILTALRSRISFPRFVKEFGECIDSEFEKYYLIGKPLGKVSAKQFLKFCERIGAQIELAPKRIQAYTNPALIEACYSAVEYAFDAVKLRELMIRRLAATTVLSTLNVSVESVQQKDGRLQVEMLHGDGEESETIVVDHVFNCTYSRLNYVVANSGIQTIALKHEMTEICQVEVPVELKQIGITVMCGPFFSVMPFPSARGLHSFSHVRYTPHYEWRDGDGEVYEDAYANLISAQRHSAWQYMQTDAARYLPILSECNYHSSIWEVKTVLPSSEVNDSRPILFLPNHGMSGFHSIMGGKIDNIYDVVDSITLQNLFD